MIFLSTVMDEEETNTNNSAQLSYEDHDGRKPILYMSTTMQAAGLHVR